MALSVHSIIISIIPINPSGTCKFKAIYYAIFITDTDRDDGSNARYKFKVFCVLICNVTKWQNCNKLFKQVKHIYIKIIVNAFSNFAT